MEAPFLNVRIFTTTHTFYVDKTCGGGGWGDHRIVLYLLSLNFTGVAISVICYKTSVSDVNLS